MKTFIPPFILSVIGLAFVVPSAVAQSVLARTIDGHPDLQGTWALRTLTPFERPAGVTNATVSVEEEVALIGLIMQQRLTAERFDPGTSTPDGDGLAIIDGQRRTSSIVQPADGHLALTPAGKARLLEKPDGYDGPEARPVNERCIADAGRAPYRVMSGEMFFQIIQTPDHLVIRKEGMDPPRIFPREMKVDRKTFLSWTGVSIASWSDNTLVIETTGFRADDPNRRISGPGSSGFPIMPSSQITEWFVPISKDIILYRYRVDDPELFLEPLVVELPMIRTTQQLFESACHEGNQSLTNTLLGARVQELRDIATSSRRP